MLGNISKHTEILEIRNSITKNKTFVMRSLNLIGRYSAPKGSGRIDYLDPFQLKFGLGYSVEISHACR